MEDNSTDNRVLGLPELKLVAVAASLQNATLDGETTSKRRNFFKTAEWSADGTCIITNSEDNHIRTFIVPQDLLEERSAPHDLTPYNTIPSFNTVNTVIGYTHFDLQNPSLALILSAANEHPIRLNSVLTSDLVASYPLVSATTEAYIKPHSLLFLDDGASFVAGSKNLISFFDLKRPGQEPVFSFKTGPKNARGHWKNPGTRLSGIVSALALDTQFSVLAAGTFSRQIGLYDSRGQGECIGVFSVVGTQADQEVGGYGVTQLSWSKCGRYLHIVERKSDGAMIYDIRQSGQLLSWITGRRALSNQRMKLDMSNGSKDEGIEIWGGGTDGKIRCWEGVQNYVGAIEPTTVYDARDNVINSIGFHKTAAVLATTSGHRSLDQCFENELIPSEPIQTVHSALKIWTL